MRIDILTIPDCPNGPLALDRVRAAVAGAGAPNGDATVESTVVTDAAGAQRWGMHGSPTILIDGRDPFAEAETRPSMSCRLYWTPLGPQGCPSVPELIEAIQLRQT